MGLPGITPDACRGRVATALAVAICLGGCSAAPQPPPPPAAPPRAAIPANPVTTAQVEPSRYVGSAVCAGCHIDEAASFARTGMGRAFRKAASAGAPPLSALARFGATIDVPGEGLRYTVFTKDGRYYQKQCHADARGRESDIDVREIHYVIGSGNHCRVFVNEHEGRLYQMPICWYPAAGRWDLCPGYELRNEHFEREINDTCLFCHDDRVERAGRFANAFKEPLPEGIGCERCHGPGSRHVQRWNEPTGQGRRRPDDIVNPAHLDAALRLQVCMQCHLSDSLQTERVLRRPDGMEAYRPGLPLQDFLSIYRYARKLPGSFGLAAQADRLALSRCCTMSGGALQCVTCHDPHVEVYEVSKRDPDHFNRACSTCHAAADCTRPPAPGSGHDCVGCHMRRAEAHDQRHAVFTDHWIRRRPLEGLEQRRDDYRLEPFFGDQAAHESEADRALSLGRAYYTKKLSTPDAGAIPWSLADQTLRRAVALAPDSAAARFYYGKAALSRGDLAEAAAGFRAALAADPRHVPALQELGSLLLERGSLQEAAVLLQAAIDAEPRGDDEATARNDLARIRMQQKRLDEARDLLDSAIRLEPLRGEILANRGLLESLRGDYPAAIGWYRRALAAAPARPAIHLYLADALSREGPSRDLDGAIGAAARAVELSPASAGARRLLDSLCAAAGRRICP